MIAAGEVLGALVGLLACAGVILLAGQRRLRHRLRRLSQRLDEAEAALDRTEDELVARRAEGRVLVAGHLAAVVRADLERPATLARARAALEAAGRTPRLALEAPSRRGLDQLAFAAFGDALDGGFVEVGAGDGRSDASTWLLSALGWRGVLVEADPLQAAACAAARPHDRTVAAAVGGPQRTEPRVAFHAVEGGRRGPGLDPPAGLGFLEPTDEAVRAVIEAGARTRRVEVPVVTLDALLQGPRLDVLVLGCPHSAGEILAGFDLARHAPRLLLVACPAEEDGADRVRAHVAAAGHALVGVVADRLVCVAPDAPDVRERVLRSPLVVPVEAR